MMLFMLDTDTVSYALRGFGDVAVVLARRNRSELCVSAITVAELRFGASKHRSRRIQTAIDAFLTGVDVRAFDHIAAARFGVVAAALADCGIPIGQLDTLIASHAIALNATLVTNNEKHFSKVTGLRIQNWT
jgi:tRNA(fMet)-specific endonuclease VapC